MAPGPWHLSEPFSAVTCFTPGTLIATPHGMRAVEDLRPGDPVVTRDNGVQKVVWAEARTLGLAELGRAPHLRPILIGQGSLGDDLPTDDMVVAPNQRILVESGRSMLAFDEHEALVAAKHLQNCRTIRAIDTPGVTYVHIMCARHEVVLANGCWCEVFQPADHSLNGLGNAQRNELMELYPILARTGGRNFLSPKGPQH
jgi:hypothetical protein